MQFTNYNFFIIFEYIKVSSSPFVKRDFHLTSLTSLEEKRRLISTADKIIDTRAIKILMN